MKKATEHFHTAMHELLDLGDEDASVLALVQCLKRLHEVVKDGSGPDRAMAEAAIGDIKVLYMAFAGEAIFAGDVRGDTPAKLAEYLQTHAIWAATFRNLQTKL